MSMVMKRQSVEELEKELAELEGQEQPAQEEAHEDPLQVQEEATKEEATEDSGKETSEKKPEKADESKDEGTFKKRYGDLRRHSQARERELQAEIESLKEKVEPAVRPLASNETVAEWKEKYPDVASIVETVANQIAEEKFQEAKLTMDDIQKFKTESVQERAKKAIRKEHEDFDTITDSDDFHDWVEDQPKWVQDAVFVNADDAKGVIRALDLYKMDKGMDRKSKQKATNDAAKSTKVKDTPDVKSDVQKFKYKESEVDAMADHEYQEHAEAIDKAMREGQFEYDISGAAR